MTDTQILSQQNQSQVQQSAQIPVEIQLFLEELIKQANIPVFDDISKQQMVKDLFDRLDQFLALKIAENLTEEETDEFIKLNEEGKSKEEIDAFIAAHIPDAQTVFNQAFVDFRDIYLNAQTSVNDAIKAENQ